MTECPRGAGDLPWALFWIVLGAAIFYGGWSMDRLEQLNINPYTAPGLVPAALGVGIAFLGLLLLVRSMQSPAADAAAPRSDLSAFSFRRLFIALTLCLAYGAGLVGRGLPFWLATFLFVFAAIAVFQWAERGPREQRVRGIVFAALCAACTAIVVTLVFQEVFLVRLP